MCLINQWFEIRENKIQYGTGDGGRIWWQPVVHKGKGGQASLSLPLNFISVIISVTHRSSHQEVKLTLPVNLEAFHDTSPNQLPLWLSLMNTRAYVMLVFIYIYKTAFPVRTRTQAAVSTLCFSLSSPGTSLLAKTLLLVLGPWQFWPLPTTAWSHSFEIQKSHFTEI